MNGLKAEIAQIIKLDYYTIYIYDLFIANNNLLDNATYLKTIVFV